MGALIAAGLVVVGFLIIFSGIGIPVKIGFPGGIVVSLSLGGLFILLGVLHFFGLFL